MRPTTAGEGWSDPPLALLRSPQWGLTILRGDVDVEVQTVLVGVLDVRGHDIQIGGKPDGQHDLGNGVVDVLGADW